MPRVPAAVLKLTACPRPLRDGQRPVPCCWPVCRPTLLALLLRGDSRPGPRDRPGRCRPITLAAEPRRLAGGPRPRRFRRGRRAAAALSLLRAVPGIEAISRGPARGAGDGGVGQGDGGRSGAGGTARIARHRRVPGRRRVGGVGVAVVDSGIAPHPALAGKVVAAVSFVTGDPSTTMDSGMGRTSPASSPACSRATRRRFTVRAWRRARIWSTSACWATTASASPATSSPACSGWSPIAPATTSASSTCRWDIRWPSRA